MRNRFDQQLAKLHSDLIIMGGLCETAIAAAVDAVTKGDVEMAKAAMADDSKIDEMERSIEHLCLKLLLQQQLQAQVLDGALHFVNLAVIGHGGLGHFHVALGDRIHRRRNGGLTKASHDD